MKLHVHTLRQHPLTHFSNTSVAQTIWLEGKPGVKIQYPLTNAISSSQSPAHQNFLKL